MEYIDEQGSEASYSHGASKCFGVGQEDFAENKQHFRGCRAPRWC